jgi:hypothetical protein
LTLRLFFIVALLAAVSLPVTGFAQTVILRSALLSGGGQSNGASVTIRAGFGESFGSGTGEGTNVLRLGVWLPGAPRATAVDDAPPTFVLQTSLGQNYPNPFNPVTVIPFSIGQVELRVQLKIYSVAGRLVRTLVDGPLPAGPQEVVWDGTDPRQQAVASGVYFYLLETASFRAQNKLVLIK